MGNMIMAETAKGTAKYPTKLLNIMSRRIKEAAEMGQCKCLLSFENLANGVEEWVTKVFVEGYGFEVTIKNEVKNIETYDGDSIFQCNITHFIIGWDNCNETISCKD